MHAARLERHGSVHTVLWTRRRASTHGYVIRSGLHGHPLSDARGEVYEHRLVLYDAIGPGNHSCRWCGTPVGWTSGLCVDHLDWDPANNDPSNLVPSCSACNAHRRQGPNRTVHLDCAVCGASTQGPRSRKYCSPACRNRAWRQRHA